MKKEVQVQVTGLVTDQWGEQDGIRLETQGTLFIRKGEYYLVYRESADSGMEGITTTLRMGDGRVILNRMGAIDFRQEFAVGQVDRGLYVTPQGSFRMSVLPQRVEFAFSPDGGWLELEYELMVDEAKVSDHRLSIQVKGEMDHECH